MIKDRIVRIKLKKNFQQHRPLSYVGKVTAFTDGWVVVDAKAILVCRSQPNGAQIDKATSAIMVPKENIESIRVLPDNFDLNTITITTDGQQIQMVVDRAADCYIGELGEG